MMKITVYMFIQQHVTLIMVNDNETMMVTVTVTVTVKMQMTMTMYIVYATEYVNSMTVTVNMVIL